MSRPGTGTAGRTGATGCGRDCHGFSQVPRSSGMSSAVKTVERWFSDRLQEEITVVRWGTLGRPVLIFPSAGGDAEEIERHGLVDACAPLLAEGRVKLYSSAPLQFLPGLDGPQLDLLRQRFAIRASGQGRWENVGESWQMASALGAKGIPNRVDNWGPEWDHEWTTWRAMLPQYLAELT